jgi:hypothetical protein
MEELLKKVEQEIEKLKEKKELTPEEKRLLLELVKEAVYLRDLILTRAALD